MFLRISLLFRSQFSHRFLHRFLMENGSQNGPSRSVAVLRFSIIFATFSEGRLFDAFWSPVGSPLAPFWHPLAAFWLPLAPFWLPLAPFWLTLAPFWLTFGALWLTFAHPGSPFSHFCCILASFLVFFHIFLENIMQNQIFNQFSPKIRFSINQIVFSRRVPNAPQQKVHPLL